MFNIHNKSIPIDDTEMYYATFGNGPRSLVVLPGLSDGLTTVKGLALFLAAPYRIFMKDFTVYMFSRKNKMPEGYSIKDMGDDLALAMTKIGIGKACVLGVSQGGMVAQCLAIYHPELVERLVLAVTAPYANDVVTREVSRWIDMAKNGDHGPMMLDIAEKMYTEKYMAKYRKTAPLVAKFTKPKSYERFFRNAYAILDFSVINELGKITAPTLILAGSDDKTVGNDAPAELKAGIPDSRLHIYEGLGHGAYEEAPDFYRRVYEFCSILNP